MRFKNNLKLRAAYLPVALVHSNPAAIRRYFDPDKLALLQASLRGNGFVDPLVVMKDKLEFAVLSGERRLAAAKALGIKRVPAVIVPPRTEVEILIAALLGSIHREPLTCFEQARAYQRVMTLSGKNAEEIALMLGVMPETVESRLRLLTLDEDAAALCESANLSEKLVERLAALPRSERNKLFFGLFNEAVDLSERANTLRERLHVDADEPPLRTIAIKDVRIFFNTIDKAIDVMKHAGVEATSERHDFDGLIEYYIRIPTMDALARR